MGVKSLGPLTYKVDVGNGLTLEAPCGLTAFPEITVDDSPDSEIEVDDDISSAPESAVFRLYWNCWTLALPINPELPILATTVTHIVQLPKLPPRFAPTCLDSVVSGSQTS